LLPPEREKVARRFDFAAIRVLANEGWKEVGVTA